ncbi:glycerol-3-phosphate dehydrogenase/oxidase [Notoacmeibacter sp. MSK16QG-6]|uniref:glycerol-3-phosphate dehydrogenase/oxidase n=1 Tax=Notoacmeibacter sp. MSK16QG-6 TaxID=2957982 RepID=UPI00209DF41B|nr:FAD-dependent oxidoreductase [Notoacmeibacter sp. MSK16QG-6]MCP1199586.1 FAD-dependent oxidoreductase [Notoacmeibacter sp. MSK16QG-6]
MEKLFHNHSGDVRQNVAPMRCDSLRRLEALTRPEVVVLGGGVNGVATLRDLALNGVSCVLLDTGDFCAGASSASSRMAHGGLRYLEGREFRLVAESAQERNRLIAHAGHLVRPMEVVVPLDNIVSGFGSAVMRFLGLTKRSGPLSLLALEGALTLYESFGRREQPLPSHSISLRRSSFPKGLQPSVKAVARYFDGRISNPEGLILEMLGEALSTGDSVAALNHVHWSFDGSAFTVQDRFGSDSYVLKPSIVINASGSWIDRVNSALGCSTNYVRGVKGAHLVLDNPALKRRMNGKAFYYDDGAGRMVITLPVGNNVLIGTTEVETPDPEDREVSGTEVDYLLKAINGLFCDIEVERSQIVSVTTGIRPLRRGNGGSATSAARDHALEEDRVADSRLPVLSLVGGKWTTFRAFAEEAADRALSRLGKRRVISTAKRDYPGADLCVASEIATIGRLSIDRAEILLQRYGALARKVAEACRDSDNHLLAGAPAYSRAEIIWLIHARAACTVQDILLRRTQLTLGSGLRRETIEDVAQILLTETGRDPNDVDAEVHSALTDPRIMGASAENEGENR